MFSILSVFTTLYILFAIYAAYKLLRFGHRDKRLPPGPPTIPILGNAHQIPSHAVHHKFREWGDKYGPIFSLKIGASTLIVLNSRQAVHDLIDKKSAIYSDRPIDKNTEHVLNDENFGFMNANPRWRTQRKIASQTLSPKAFDEKIAPIHEAEVCQLVYDLLETPEDFFNHVKRVTASVAAIVIFGHRAATPDSFWTTCVYDAMGMINPALEPGSYLPTKEFPILKYFPDFLAPSKARAKRAYKDCTAIYAEARRRVEARRKEGDDRNSIADRILSGGIKLESAWSATETSNYFAVFHEAASDTTSSMTLTDILYLAKNPWVQDKAQVELDRVCGERMPTWEDFKDLPYINCVVKEGLRIRPVAPTGVPHRVTQDDWYAGYLIPKDSTIYLPSHTLNRLCPDPDTYNPDRYLSHPKLAMDYAGSPDYANRDHYAYGSGRRICVGIHLAERTQWRIIARLLWAYRILPAVDEMGREVGLEEKFREEFLVCPEPFRVRFLPRSGMHERVVREGYEGSKEFLRRWE